MKAIYETTIFPTRLDQPIAVAEHAIDVALDYGAPSYIQVIDIEHRRTLEEALRKVEGYQGGAPDGSHYGEGNSRWPWTVKFISVRTWAEVADLAYVTNDSGIALPQGYLHLVRLQDGRRAHVTRVRRLPRRATDWPVEVLVERDGEAAWVFVRDVAVVE
jgi:hypothetical protein